MVSKPSPHQSIDVAASKARVAAARRLASQQAKAVASSAGVDRHAIDLQFLLDESVLVFEETDAMLHRLAACAPIDTRSPSVDPPKTACCEPRRARRPTFRDALQMAAVVIAALFVIEIADPAPLEVAASDLGLRLPSLMLAPAHRQATPGAEGPAARRD